MAATLSTKLNVQLDAILQNLVGVANVQANLSRGQLTVLTSGTGANQADKVYSETKSAAAAYDVDLAGVLLDAYGVVITFARVKAIVVIADPNNVGNVIVGNAAANAFGAPFGAVTHTVNVRPGGVLAMLAPDVTAWPVTAATADILRFAPSSGTVVFDFAIVGASV